jgi:hypothetical protein
VLNLAAAAFNYLFQVLAARELSREQFGEFSAWFAWLSLTLIVSSIAQYAANFQPRGSISLRLLMSLWVLGALTAGLAITSVYAPHADLALAVCAVSITTLLGWLCGQAQYRLMFSALALAAIAVAISKVLLVVGPWNPPSALRGYQLAMTLGVLPALAMIGLQLFWARTGWQRLPKVDYGLNTTGWTAALVLAVATAGLPQVDLLALSVTVQDVEFEEVARASLFTKAMFFLVLLGAQWALPHQIRNHGGQHALAQMIWRVLGASMLATLLALWMAPQVSHALGWETSLPPPLLALSCGNMALLGCIYLAIQHLCTGGQVRVAAEGLALVALLAAVQWTVSLDMLVYLGLAILTNAVVLVHLVRQRLAVAGPTPG